MNKIKEIKASVEEMKALGFANTHIYMNNINKATMYLTYLLKEREGIKLELSCPETIGMENDPLYKWAASVNCAKLEAQKEQEEQDFVINKFSEWYNDSECPQEAHGFCPGYESIKEEYIEDNKDEPDYDINDFSPCKELCGTLTDGGCYAAYYRKLFRDKSNPPSNKENK